MEYVFAGHGAHEVALPREYDPGAHGVHPEPAPPPYVPAGHAVHDVAAIVESNVDPGAPAGGALSDFVVAA